MNAFEDQAFRQAVEATGRRRLIIGGLHTEICLSFATVQALKDGYEVQPCLLGDPAECARLVELAMSEFGRIDVLYNLAARSHLHWFDDFTNVGRPGTQGAASGPGSSGNACGILREWPVRGAIRAIPRHYAAPDVTRASRRRALPGLCLRSGAPGDNGQVVGITRARAGHDLHARGSGAARCLRPPVHPEPGHVPDLGWADRRGFWCRLQGDAGIALDLGASAPNTVLGFAILVGLGVAVSGWMLLVRKPNQKEI